MPETRSTEHAWLDYRAAQEYSGLSRTFLWGRICAGELRAYKVGRKVRIDRDDLDAFMRSRSAASGECTEEICELLGGPTGTQNLHRSSAVPRTSSSRATVSVSEHAPEPREIASKKGELR